MHTDMNTGCDWFGTLGEWMTIAESTTNDEKRKCFSHAQQLDDRERLKRLRRQQYRKGNRFK